MISRFEPVFEPRDEGYYPLAAVVNPGLNDSICRYKRGLDLAPFSEGLQERVASITRRGMTSFGVGSIDRLSLPDEHLFSVPFDYSEQAKGEGLQTTVRTYKVGVFNTPLRTDFLISIPQTPHQRSTLSQLKDSGDDLSIRAGHFDESDDSSLYSFFDPDQVGLITDVVGVYNDIRHNHRSFGRYFSQMAGLFTRGAFPSLASSKDLIVLKGFDSQNTPLIFDGSFKPEQKVSESEIPDFAKSVSLDKIKALESLISRENPWYREGYYARPLDINAIVDAYCDFGNAFSQAYFHGFPISSASATAAEHFVSEVYGALLGKDDWNGESFYEKLAALNNEHPFSGAFDEFLAVYRGSEDRISPAKIRNRTIHQGRNHLTKDFEGAKDYWAGVYYIDLVKTATSHMMGFNQTFYDFDTYARRGRLIDESVNLAYVPLSKRSSDAQN